MKIFNIGQIIILIYGMSNTYSFHSDLMIGHWFQVWNNKYVQVTNEIDWNCVNVSIHQINNSLISIQKSAILHDNPKIIIHTNNSYKLDNQELYPLPIPSIISPILDIKIMGPIIENKYQYLILTGKDNMSMFTLTRDINEFNEKYLHEVSNLLISYDYTGYYKSPMSSYNNYCLY